MSKQKNVMKSNQREVTVWMRTRHLLPTLADLFLVAFGSITLAWVGQLTLHDITVWGKDLALIFFGSRTGENISLGIGMKVIHYFLIGLTLLLLGLVTLLRRRSKKKKAAGQEKRRQLKRVRKLQRKQRKNVELPKKHRKNKK